MITIGFDNKNYNNTYDNFEEIIKLENYNDIIFFWIIMWLKDYCQEGLKDYYFGLLDI